ncbi:MAG TPA: hypothetical protein VN176_14850 [Verrucomicrobiae bacterium]|nr:hypothetical protein [Verrucomicrobiae bacterium]
MLIPPSVSWASGRCDIFTIGGGPQTEFGEFMSALSSHFPRFSLGLNTAVGTLVLLNALNIDFARAEKLMLPHHMRDLSERTHIWRSQFPKEDLSLIVRLLSKDIDPSGCLENEKIPAKRKIVRSFRIERIRLTAEDKTQYIIGGWGSCVCGAVGNCPVWILEKRAEGFTVLLSNGGYGGYNGFSVEETSTNGYKDMILRSHDSASSHYLFAYRFSKGGYRLFQCSFVDYWKSDMAGKRSSPEITKQKCK